MKINPFQIITLYTILQVEMKLSNFIPSMYEFALNKMVAITLILVTHNIAESHDSPILAYVNMPTC